MDTLKKLDLSEISLAERAKEATGDLDAIRGAIDERITAERGTVRARLDRLETAAGRIEKQLSEVLSRLDAINRKI